MRSAFSTATVIEIYAIRRKFDAEHCSAIAFQPRGRIRLSYRRRRMSRATRATRASQRVGRFRSSARTKPVGARSRRRRRSLVEMRTKGGGGGRSGSGRRRRRAGRRPWTPRGRRNQEENKNLRALCGPSFSSSAVPSTLIVVSAVKWSSYWSIVASVVFSHA